MKRFFSMMLAFATATALMTSCDVDDDITGTFSGDKYNGSVSVTTPAMYPGGSSTVTDQEDVTLYFDEDNSLAKVSLVEICFTKNMDISVEMPALNIVLPNIPEVSADVYEAASVTATMVDGQPYGDEIIKSITNVKVVDSEEVGADLLTVTFDCTVSIDMSGSGTPTEVTFSVAFSGYEL